MEVPFDATRFNQAEIFETKEANKAMNWLSMPMPVVFKIPKMLLRFDDPISIAIQYLGYFDG